MAWRVPMSENVTIAPKKRTARACVESLADINTIYEEIMAHGKSENKTPRFSPFFIFKMLPNMAAGL